MIMAQLKKPGILTGGFVGGLFSALLMAIFYLGDRLAGLPFVPFDVFDWVARILPGDVVAAGIGAIVAFIVTFGLEDTSAAAKFIEQLMALGMVLLGGVVTGIAVFRLLSLQSVGRMYRLGALAGIVAGAALALISADVNRTATAPPLLNAVWIVVLCAGWGLALSGVYRRLAALPSGAVDAGGEIEFEEHPAVEQINRRQFLVRLGGATATLTVIGAGVGLLLDNDGGEIETAVQADDGRLFPAEPFPNADSAVPPVPGTRPEYTPLDEHYRIDINLRPPSVDLETWRLRVTGLVREPLELTLDDLMSNYEPMHQYVTMSCISNWVGGNLISTTRWTGVPVATLLDDWGLQRGASHLKITAADSFDEWLEIRVVRLDQRVMLAYAWDGQLLKQQHGAPLRVYIPNRYGMKQPKWITEIEVVNYWDEGYWVRRGWSESALVRTTSVIDTVAVDHTFERDGQTLIPIGGIAYSGTRAISKVEVRVGDGDWMEAELREPLSGTTWVLWRYEWPYELGTHTFRVRCYDSSGVMQIDYHEDPRPNGAAGIHAVRTEIPPEL
jgi:DMSO/TMAO reductase YedYZ molybdopterin-dependent catalytic subunit